MNPEHEPSIDQSAVEQESSPDFSFEGYINTLPEDTRQDHLELFEIWKEAYKNDALKTHTTISNFVKKTEQENPNIRKTQLFHMLTSSGQQHHEWISERFDLDDGSIERFIREELASIKPKES